MPQIFRTCPFSSISLKPESLSLANSFSVQSCPWISGRFDEVLVAIGIRNAPQKRRLWSATATVATYGGDDDEGRGDGGSLRWSLEGRNTAAKEFAIGVEDDEIVLEIFSWLPATAIQKFKSASDFFCTMPLEERHFVLKQSHNALLRKDPCFFLQPNSCKKYSAINEFHHFPSEKTSSGVPHNFLKFLDNYPACRILASSNGLILGCSTKKNNQTELFISNPSTESWFLIPTLNHLKEYPDSEIILHLNVIQKTSCCFSLRVLKIRVRAMGIIEEEPIIVKGFIVMNGDCLVFATKKKVYSYGLSRENYRVVEEISEHGFDDDEVCFTCYSDTLRLCGDGATTLPLPQQSY
ncbi:F-box protein [Senna tora]|uniref:F-box protein n=1 Tax=Senna tora TaxID=362788 RepID=A0A834WRP1_9FABA|nr:F-box protein [Senna tora]